LFGIKASNRPPTQDQDLIAVDASLDKGLNRNMLRPFPLDILARVVRGLVEIRQTFGAFTPGVAKAVRDQPFLFSLARRPEGMGGNIRPAPDFQDAIGIGGAPKPPIERDSARSAARFGGAKPNLRVAAPRVKDSVILTGFAGWSDHPRRPTKPVACSIAANRTFLAYSYFRHDLAVVLIIDNRIGFVHEIVPR
jgi:hypothetical protein